jgi:nitroreductase
MDLLDALQWRYATKKFDSTKRVDQKLVDQIIDAAWLAPTSSGLQPFKVIEITNQDLKNKIVPISDNQHQVADASHLLVFAAWDDYTEQRIDRIYGYIAHERGLPPDINKDYTDLLKSVYLNRPAQPKENALPMEGYTNFDHAAHQAYIAFAMAIAMAAELKVDTTPIEGFDNKALDELLNLRKQGLKSVLMLPLGYRDSANDWLVSMKKVRHPKNEFLVKIK